MKLRLHAVIVAFGLGCAILPGLSLAGYDEGLAAYNKKDYAAALREWRPLATQGDVSAQLALGVIYENGQGVPQDSKEAAKWYRLAAEQGNANAQKNLGVMYAYGRGVLQDYKEAIKWYRLAAEQGNANAQNNLGGMYATGQSVPQDYKEAVKWSRLAAGQGNANAQFGLGMLYANGQGVPQDYKEAVKWYRLAAEQGNADAQNNLGAMYIKGQGVAANRIVAYALYNLSAAGDPSKENPATSNRVGLAESMSTMEIEAAQTLTREMAKNGNLLKTLDRYVKATPVKEKSKPVASHPVSPRQAAPADDGYPARPAKQPGVVSCNARCNNADCWRTYDDGQKVRFQAKRKFDPISGEWKFDSGGC